MERRRGAPRNRAEGRRGNNRWRSCTRSRVKATNAGRDDTRTPRLSPAEISKMEEWKALGQAKLYAKDQFAPKPLALGCPSNTLIADNVVPEYSRMAYR